MTPTPIHYLEVYHCPFNKIRVGRKHDGGYGVCETDVKYDVLLSAGISDDISFDNDFLKLYDIPAYAFDSTIEGIPQGQYASNKLQWVCKNIGINNNEKKTNLIEYIEKYNNIFLKMDIEGGEYGFFQALTQEHLEKISQIVIEFHQIHKYQNPTDRNSRCIDLEVLKTLNKTHTILHAHCNNTITNLPKTRDGYRVPRLLELTLVRTTDILKQFPNYIKRINSIPYPHACDYPNDPNRQEVALNYYPFFKKRL